MIVIVIPCFNEAKRLEPGPFVSFIAAHREVMFLFVDDGSADATPDRLAEINRQAGERVRLLSLEANMGKGEAVRRGILDGLGLQPSHIGYWDGDLATPLSELPAFIAQSAEQSKKMIFGSRIQRLGADITRHWYRHYPGRLIAFWINMILRLPVHDTQCGAKLIEAGLAAQICKEPFLSAWLFDVELFARIIGLVGRDEATRIIYEIPLQRWEDVGRSKIALSYLPKIPLELGRIYLHYRSELKG